MIAEEEILAFASGRNLLLVEDNEINAQIAEAQLKPAGFNVVWAENGELGLEKYLESEPGFYSAIITDLMMPVMDGIEVALHVRKSERSDSELPILGITANAFPKELGTFKDGGLDGCLTKPYKREQILEWLYDKVTGYEDLNG